jgi:hypothetical protein
MALNKDEFLASQSELVNELKNQLKEKERVLESYKKEHGRLEVFFSAVSASIAALQPQPQTYVHKSERSTSPVIAVAQITDGHMGAVQPANEIEGFNEFNPEICHRRQIDFIERYNKWIDRERLSYTINECVILVTGDLISGDIHDELKITNAFPVTVQVVKASQVLSEQLSMLAQNFDKVTVHFVVADNHSRLTHKPQSKQEGLNSLNYLVGILSESYLKEYINQKRVEFNIYPVHEKVVKVGNRNYLISHGHGVRGWMGKPWYGFERKVQREATARMDLAMNEKIKLHEIGFHKYIFGHYHTPFQDLYYWCSGSVQGTDAYDHKNGRYAPPSQPGWLVHPRWREQGRIDFELT